MNNKLLAFVTEISRLVERADLGQESILKEAGRHMEGLVARDDWLPASMAQPHPKYYQQHLLYGDLFDRFSVVSFVWGPGQFTPVHDHTVWGVIGMLRGAEREVPYERTDDGRLLPSGPPRVLEPGDVACVAPGIGDIHAVSNALDDEVSISIHLYGGNIGKIQRNTYDPQTGSSRPFVSGYSNALLPNLWAMERGDRGA
ncbi:cysteine dioxygenase [Pusillimonas caeni]|uniref:cysteine dioxygenase family protein n=1 Tax=Pusillimonas caeni TaxID=1348472 RepID=UPI000E59EE0E|nr:cysteine dioxygenase [Pusillimonas caeni]TFL15794.1 cysteine dioxygenase [Pusillimonas caeni]